MSRGYMLCAEPILFSGVICISIERVSSGGYNTYEKKHRILVGG
jgi:hypothetical protein